MSVMVSQVSCCIQVDRCLMRCARLAKSEPGKCSHQNRPLDCDRYGGMASQNIHRESSSYDLSRHIWKTKCGWNNYGVLFRIQLTKVGRLEATAFLFATRLRALDCARFWCDELRLGQNSARLQASRHGVAKQSEPVDCFFRVAPAFTNWDNTARITSDSALRRRVVRRLHQHKGSRFNWAMANCRRLLIVGS